jgi:predicted enzyme related to lactoylglutathione lyase
MLASKKIVGFVPSKDFERSKAFYGQVLGLEFVSEDEFAVVFRAAGNVIRISGTRDYTPAQHTILGWVVEDIEATVTTLKDRGVKFEDYSFLTQNDLGIWDAPSGARVAWFKDPDDNVLSVAQSSE